MIGGAGRHLLPEILSQTDRVGAKSSIFDLFSLVAPQLRVASSSEEKVQLTLII